MKNGGGRDEGGAKRDTEVQDAKARAGVGENREKGVEGYRHKGPEK